MIALLLAGCNRYELFLIEDDRGAHPNAADVLFVIDNSDSMYEESVALAENFSAFVTQLAARDVAARDGLPDAVDGYIDYSRDPAYYVDYQLAITTIDARDTTGALRGDPKILHKGDPNLAGEFIQNLLCDATCFADRRLVEVNLDYQCGQPWDGQVHQQFLDCLCGVDAWIDHCGGGTEEGLEAVYDAMCRAVDDPPPECFEDTALTAAESGSSAGLIREDSTFIPVIITDEGDASHRLQNVDALPAKYVDLVAAFGVPTAWAIIGPGLDDDLEVVCGEATSWGTLRYEYMAEKTGGVKLDIHDPACLPADFSAALTQLGNLIGGGIRAYRLPSEPVPGSIVVEVGGKAVHLAETSVGEDVFGEPVYTEGWSYEAESRTVLLHGDTVPSPGEPVRIYYWPAS